MNRFDKLAELLFTQKDDRFPWDEVNSDHEILSELDQCLEIGGRPYAILVVSNGLLEACQRKMEQSIDSDWFRSWGSTILFISNIIHHFEAKARLFLERDLIPFIFGDKRLANLTFDASVLQLVDDRIAARMLRHGIVANFFSLTIADHERLDLLKDCVESKAFYWLKYLFEQSKVHLIEASAFADYLMEQTQSDNRDEILRCVLCGIVNRDLNGGYKLYERILNDPSNRWIAIGALSYVDVKDSDCKFDILDKIEALPLLSSKDQEHLVRVYLSYLTNLASSNKFLNRCFEAILRLCDSEDQQVLNAIVNNLSIEVQPETMVYDILLRILDNKSHSRDYYKIETHNINLFDGILASDKSKTSGFFEFLEQFVLKADLIFQEQIFSISLKQKINKNNRTVRKFIIRCLSSTYGRVRYLGNVLLDEFIQLFPNALFEKELVSLKEPEKVIVILSIRYFLPFTFVDRFKVLIPLIKLQEELVSILLIKVITSMIDDFPSIVSVLKDNFGNDNSWSDTLKTLETYREQVGNIAWEKVSVQELSPKVTHARLYRLHQAMFSRKFKDDVTQSAWEKSILSRIGTRIFLLKGGGWKAGPSKDQPIGKLGRHETSVTVPTYIYRNPERDQLNISQFFSVNFKSNSDLEEWLIRFL